MSDQICERPNGVGSVNRLTSPIRQIGIIVRDIDAAMRYWTELAGIGPFVVFRNLELDDDWRYRGENSKPPTVDLAIGYSGSLQFELIQQLNDAPSGFADYLAEGREGMQHVSPQFASPEEYDAAYQQLLGRGLEVVHEGRMKGAPYRIAYFALPGGGWPHIEISEVRHPDMLPAFEHIEKLNATWNGSTPAVIEVMDLAEMGSVLGLS